MNYKVYLSTKISSKNLKKGSGIIVLESDNYRDSEVSAIKRKGYIVLAYLSVGTIEKERSWWKTYSKFKLKRLEDWPNEYYVDVRQKAWRQFLYARAKALMAKGYGGLWCDNLDVYEYNKSKEMFAACQKVLTELKKIAKYVMVNGGAEFFDYAYDHKIPIKPMTTAITQEEVFSRVTSYSGKGKFGTQKSDMNKYYMSYMKRMKKSGIQTFPLEYTRSDSLKKKIKDFCKKEGMTGYYISEDVDL